MITKNRKMLEKGRMGKEVTPPQLNSILIHPDFNVRQGLLSPHRDSFSLTFQKIRKMRRHPTIKLVRQLVLAPVISAHWSIEEKEGVAPEGAKEFIKDQLMPLREDLLRTTFLGCLDYGFQPYEKIFKIRKDNMICLKHVKPLLQDLTICVVDEYDGSYQGLKQNDVQGNEVYLTPETALWMAFDVEGTNWYGEGVFEAIEPVYDLWEGVNKAADRYDTKVAGSHWVVHYPVGESIYEGTKVNNEVIANKILNSLESSGKIAVPRQVEGFIDELNKDSPNAWQIELLTHHSTAATDFTVRLKYCDALLVRCFGVPERSVLEGQHGTKAEASSHADAAIVIMGMRHSFAVQAYNKGLVDHLLRLNYGPDAEGSVYIVPSPIDNDLRRQLAKVYETILKDPTGFVNELESLDLGAIRNLLGVPFFAEGASTRHPGEY
jgi:hypothetical protein